MTHEHPMPAIERHCDVAVIGGSAAGLAGGLHLARQRRSVIVVDDAPRDAPAAHADGHPGREVFAPSEPLAVERAELRSHGGEILQGRALGVHQLDDARVAVELTGGHRLIARRVLTATGLADELPAQAAARGDRSAAAIAIGLAQDDLADASRISGRQLDWEQRYGTDEAMWSGNPNGTMVEQVGGLPPGRALDVGAGEGADALWLAEQGWQVTATDISGNALARIAREAGRRGLDVRCLRADANDPAPFGTGTFELVSLQYGSFHRTPDRRGLRNLLAAVAPGGTLLVVGHDLTPLREPHDVNAQTRMFDPEAYVGVEQVAADLDDATWRTEVHETRPRPPGAATAHHVDDVVLRAIRL